MATRKGHGWVITEDTMFETGDTTAVGVHGGKRGAALAALVTAWPDATLPPGVERFEMYDDDNTLCFKGLRLMVGGCGFEPLDDFGQGHSGCTYIKTDGGKNEMTRL